MEHLIQEVVEPVAQRRRGHRVVALVANRLVYVNIQNTGGRDSGEK